jgi:hypothetical protein
MFGHELWGGKWSWPISRRYPSIILDRLRKTTEILSQDNPLSSQIRTWKHSNASHEHHCLNQFLLRKVWGFHGRDYEECRLLGYGAMCDLLEPVLLFTANAVYSSFTLFLLMMEAVYSFETSALTRTTRRHITEHGILQFLLCYDILCSCINVNKCIHLFLYIWTFASNLTGAHEFISFEDLYIPL